MQVDATSAWGSETLFQFKYFDNGNYALATASGDTGSVKYLSSEGVCVDANDSLICAKSKGNGFTNGGSYVNGCITIPPKNCLFTIEYHGGFIAFRDRCGRYLAAAGRQAVLRTRATAVGKDELFSFEPAPLQVSLRATFNNRWVSTKQGESNYFNLFYLTHRFCRATKIHTVYNGLHLNPLYCPSFIYSIYRLYNIL